VRSDGLLPIAEAPVAWSHVIRPSLNDFVEPNWTAPLDVVKALEAIPETATITGMFIEPTARAARAGGKSLPAQRERYLPFRYYPLREHVQLLLEACAATFPGRPLRTALRKLGRAGPNAFLASTLGRVSVGSGHGTHDYIERLAKSYSISLSGARGSMLTIDDHNAVVQLQNVHFFLACHHVGVFEGVMRYAGVQGEVKIKSHSPHSADLWCSWT
jgi:uncharacterized protein (TIGR02265 family)